MTTINHESYVSFEVSKLLKQAGFDWKCNLYFSELNAPKEAGIFDAVTNKVYGVFDSTILGIGNPTEDDILRPTLDVAQKWLREVKGIYVESVLCVNRGTSGHSFGFSIAEISADLSTVKILYPLTYFDEEETKGFMKYELSLEVGIKKALEIILEKGE